MTINSKALLMILPYRENCNRIFEKNIYKNTGNKDYILITINRVGNKRGESMIEHNNLASFQLQLLTRIIDVNKFPFTKIVIENNVTEEEYNQMFMLLEKIDFEYLEQKEEGLLDFSSLLAKFRSQITEKLNPIKVIYAMKKEGFFTELLDEFIQIIKKDGL